ncbi:branched-chain amino acid ABC transporter permease [Meridianimarinicoccus roseus]|jgi:branched-chain amino acid transport system permease protein|uniref:Branched-chain amino acid ABC transporter permease n=1 Tax=Meridianimarinicoccus roseus TaxID=2072018 RepID=A0A2V2LN23_9RHOB|nr:branched-chain amino acid ABC transporter permease [Meridianimarinicoccus roseus]PWR04606.1 branched-chain amino acid ABC transporter permease [Meridianimarinicoccus roseus]
MIASTLISGLALGSMYGLMALGFHVTYAVSKTVNFSQGSSMMFGAVMGYTFSVTLGWPLIFAVIAALACCAVLGLAVERFLVRPFARRGSDAWLMATVAGGIVLDNVILFTFGKEPRSFSSPLAENAVDVFGVGAYPLQLIIPVVGLGIALGLALVTAHTRLGKAMLAAVQRPETARLMGVDTQAVIAAAFAISAVFAGIAGLLIAPLFSVSAGMGVVFGLKAFAAAIIGGIQSAWGVMLAGLIYGCVEAVTTAYIGSSYTQIVSFSAVILVLVTMPNGIFGRAEINKV